MCENPKQFFWEKKLQRDEDMVKLKEVRMQNLRQVHDQSCKCLEHTFTL